MFCSLIFVACQLLYRSILGSYVSMPMGWVVRVWHDTFCRCSSSNREGTLCQVHFNVSAWNTFATRPRVLGKCEIHFTFSCILRFAGLVDVCLCVCVCVCVCACACAYVHMYVCVCVLNWHWLVSGVAFHVFWIMPAMLWFNPRRIQILWFIWKIAYMIS